MHQFLCINWIDEVGVLHSSIENIQSTWNLPHVASCGSTGRGFILYSPSFLAVEQAPAFSTAGAVQQDELLLCAGFV